jgi:hypothetical protein
MFGTMLRGILVLTAGAFGTDWMGLESELNPDYRTRNMAPPLLEMGEPKELPVHVASFDVHVRGDVGPSAPDMTAETVPSPDGSQVNGVADLGGLRWVATDNGLYFGEPGAEMKRHDHYGVDGPLATKVTALAAGRNGNLWVGTPLGLSMRDTEGNWYAIRGRQGLPYEDITAIAVDPDDNLWIGTSRGVIHYRPNDRGRQWFYRAGPRYLPHDEVESLALSSDSRSIYVTTPAGVSTINVVTKTLRQKADNLEALIEKRHRRRGLVAACEFEGPEEVSRFTVPAGPNDGLWTAYHVTALSLAYATTQDAAHKESARTGMHALYMLQNASGIPGLPARSVLPVEDVEKKRKKKNEEWHPSPEGELYWRGDTSSDEYCGHYMAFYTYWEHIARHDPAERELLIYQVRQMTDYLLKNNYQLIDVDGERTVWGFWNPEILNEDPWHYLENGLNALQITSFLKVTHHITGDQKYQEHYLKLMQEHDYLSNILTTKKLFPDESNHSDDQLGFCAWYPILQLEQDPKIRMKLHQGVRRHWLAEEPERPSFFTFVYATIDPNHADIDGAIQNLMEIPEDRRNWRMENSHRTDVSFDPRSNRFDRPMLRECLPADERNFEKWNNDPFEPDGGDVDGLIEESGATYLLPYWMGRYHGLFSED